MNVIKHNSLNVEEIEISALKLLGKEKNIKRMNLTLEGSECYVQFPRSRAPFGPSCFNKDGNEGTWNLDISLKDDHPLLVKIETLVEQVKKHVGENSKEIWGKKKSADFLNDCFKSPITPTKEGTDYPPRVKLQLPKRNGEFDVEVYNQNKELVDVDYIEKGCEVIPIVQLSHVWFVGSDFGIKFKAALVKVYKKEKLSGYNFIDSSDEDSSEVDEEEEVEFVSDD